MRCRSAVSAVRCGSVSRFSLSSALASSAARAQAGRGRSTMHALGQRVGSQSADKGAGAACTGCFRQSDVAGSRSSQRRYRRGACGRGWRAACADAHYRRACPAAERARRPWHRVRGRSADRRDRKARLQPGASQSKRVFRRAGQCGAALRPRRGSPMRSTRRSPRRRRPRRAYSRSSLRSCRTVGSRCAKRWCAGTDVW